MKSARLEKELSRFKAKEQKSGEQLGKDTSAMKENQAHSTAGQQKSRENPTETIEEEEVQPSQSPRIRGSTPNIGTKRHTMEKQSYAAVAASKPS